jgi:hypothetical protein
LTTANWKTSAELIGMTAIVASLIFVGLQLRQEQAIAIVDTYGSIVESSQGVLDLIGQHPEVWEKGLLGEELSTPDEIVFSGMVHSVINHHTFMFIRFVRIGPGDHETLLHNFAYALYVFPGLRRRWETDGELQDMRLAAQNRPVSLISLRPRIDRYLRNFDKIKPSIPTEKQFIFWFF